jgi:hypothetical protein
MLRAGFEPMTPVFEGTKTVHALDRAATVIGRFMSIYEIMIFCIILSNDWQN